ncbi:MAG: recombinase family protein, partial [Clostridium sp.]|nr:recombinase family protein [Clostridium sp.]
MQIARQLEKEQILVPVAYFESVGRKHAQKVPKSPYGWEQATVGYILENRQYTGCAVNFKSTTVSYKVHKKIRHSEEDYQIIPDMQEAIISEEQWLRVQELRKHKRRPTKTGRTSLFSGLVYCPDCGAKLHFCAAKSLKRNQEFWRCSK